MAQCPRCNKKVKHFDRVFGENLGRPTWDGSHLCFECLLEYKREFKALDLYRRRMKRAKWCAGLLICIALFGFTIGIATHFSMHTSYNNPTIIKFAYALGIIFFIPCPVCSFMIARTFQFDDPDRGGYYTEKYVELEYIGNDKWQASEKESTHSYSTDPYEGLGKPFVFITSYIWAGFYLIWACFGAKKACIRQCSTDVYNAYTTTVKEIKKKKSRN